MVGADENVEDVIDGLIGFVVEVDGAVPANGEIQSSEHFTCILVGFLPHPLEKIHDDIENVIVGFGGIEIKDFTDLKPNLVCLARVLIELRVRQELEFVAHHLLIRFFIERSREVEVELARRKDAIVLGSRPPFPGQFVCVGALEPDVK